MAQLSTLIPFVRERCGGVLEKFALDHIKRAYQKFCAESLYLARSQQFNQGEAALLPIDDDHAFGGVSFVLDANGHELERGIDYNVSVSGEVFITKNTSAFKVFYYVLPLFSLPDDFNASETIISKYADYLADGAASTLMKMPNPQWTDINFSEHYRRNFIDGYRLGYREAINALDEQRPTKPREFY